MRVIAFLCFFAACFACSVRGDERTTGEEQFLKLLGRDCPVVRLWPDGQVPDEPQPMPDEAVRYDDPKRGRTGLLRIENVTRPSMIIMAPPKEKSIGVALLYGPGGGYNGLASETYGATAKWMNERGITFVLLKYRVGKRHNGYPINHQPLQDAQRAMGILRARAGEWGIHRDKIGIGGVSAGGHLAASLAINHAKRWYKPVDEFDAVSCRPDFAVLHKPAYLMEPMVSRERDPRLHYELMNASDTPPTLIAINRPDKFTIGSIEYYLALMEADVPAELHIYPEGGHGEPIEKYPFGEWAVEWQRFLVDQKIIAPAAFRAGSRSERQPAAFLPHELASSTSDPIGDAAIRKLLPGNSIIVPLWPEKRGPDETLDETDEVVTLPKDLHDVVRIRRAMQPSLTVLPAKNAAQPTRAVIVCPGGGYSALSIEREGTQVCQWLNSLGITAVLLKYRVPKRGGAFPKHHHALQDLQRAVRTVRSRAADWNIAPKDIGVCGFSAGGHLCAALCTNWKTDHYAPRDDFDHVSPRPDFAILTYPAYLTSPRESNEVDPFVKHLRRNDTPPMFMSVARNDKFARGVLNFFLEVQAAKIPAELHVYASGGHGQGIKPESHPMSEWTGDCARWLKDLDSRQE